MTAKDHLMCSQTKFDQTAGKRRSRRILVMMTVLGMLAAGLLPAFASAAAAQTTGRWVRGEARIIGGFSDTYESSLGATGGPAHREILTRGGDTPGQVVYGIEWEAPPAVMTSDQTEELRVSLGVSSANYEGFALLRLSAVGFIGNSAQSWTTFPFVDTTCRDGILPCENTAPNPSIGSMPFSLGGGNTDGQVKTFQFTILNCSVCAVAWDYIWDADYDPNDLEPGSPCAGLTPTHVGTQGDDSIYATNGPDIIFAYGGDDQIWGRQGDDIICAGPGNDRVFAGNGNNILYGSSGIDKMRAGPDQDLIYGGDDRDFLKGGHGNDIIYGENGSDRIRGSLGDDVLYGGRDNDVMWGGPGNDHLFGQQNDDILKGSAGTDICDGGPGNDQAKPDCTTVVNV